jgi:hypothetical protein
VSQIKKLKALERELKKNKQFQSQWPN